MSSSRLSKYYDTASKGEIKVYELQYNNIKDEDINNVKKLIRSLNKEFICHFFIVFLFTILALFMTYDSLKEEPFTITKDLIFMIAIVIALVLVLIYIARQIRSSRKLVYKKAQYGIVKNKYNLKVTAKSGSPKNYYIDATFSDTNTYIRRVLCTPKTYNILNEGGHVLVISFDNKKSYAVPCNI